ncbi:abscission/NoCut checkpoint regulator isoform X3 [Monodelphis domestica]|uniref:abscission/NoCut checkpoint regulator isoform X3 n=1 Tax=Monodelphis domestica TaxID=13616 RepID=UPI0024E1E175|nr:abscission/NoCut checkpoint regulator isoform X3 [Monodelphis domestica]
MESRCYGCAVKFSLFRKECGCKNCGRAFCSNCLSFSTAVPRFGNTQQKVCKPCYEVLTRGPSEASVSKWSPPENYKKRVAALETKQKLIASRGLVQPQGLTQEDQVIAKRLEKLRQETKPKVAPSQAEIEARLAALRNDPPGPIPSTEEMEDRLAVLQGRVPPSQAPRLVHQPPDTRTQAQQAEDLLTQLAAEVAIDESCDPETSASNRSLQNDLNRDSPRGWNMNPAELAPQQLQGEKGRLLAEAAAELREENTREERILALAKQLAVLRGQDPEREPSVGRTLSKCSEGVWTHWSVSKAPLTLAASQDVPQTIRGKNSRADSVSSWPLPTPVAQTPTLCKLQCFPDLRNQI